MGDWAEVQRLLKGLRDRHPEEDEAVMEIERLLDRMEPPSKTPSARRRGEETTYLVEDRKPAAVLAERRATGQPLRVPRPVYDAVVRAIREASKPVTFDEITSTPNVVSQRPAEWQVRVVLRFLQRGDAPLVVRSRSRYRAVEPRTIVKGAATWWQDHANTKGSA